MKPFTVLGSHGYGISLVKHDWWTRSLIADLSCSQQWYEIDVLGISDPVFPWSQCSHVFKPALNHSCCQERPDSRWRETEDVKITCIILEWTILSLTASYFLLSKTSKFIALSTEIIPDFTLLWDILIPLLQARTIQLQ